MNGCIMDSRSTSSVSLDLFGVADKLSAGLKALTVSASGLALFLAAGCADRNSIAYRVQNYEEPAKVQSKDARQPGTPTNGATKPTGPVRLNQPRQIDVSARNTRAEPESRFAFLDWFGKSANAARVQNSAAELRKSRDVTASMQVPTETSQPARYQPVTIGEDSRLVVTFNSALPRPAGDAVELRGADITGSVSQTQVEDPKQEPVSQDDAVKRELLQVEKRLLSAQTRGKETQVRSASTESVQEFLPSKDNPVRMQLSTGHSAFDHEELETLKVLAAQHFRTGRILHVRAVTRGRSGDTGTSINRIRRLNGHTKRAILALSGYGVDPHKIGTSTAEQRTTGVVFGTSRRADRDRLEFSFE